MKQIQDLEKKRSNDKTFENILPLAGRPPRKPPDDVKHDPPDDFEDFGDFKDISISHLLCLTGEVTVAMLDNDFHKFWYEKNADRPKEGGLTQRFHSFNFLRRVVARIIKFIRECRKGWAQKAEKKPPKFREDGKLSCQEITLKNSEKHKEFLNKFPLKVEEAEESGLFLFRVAQYTSLKEDMFAILKDGVVSAQSPIYRLRAKFDDTDYLLRMTS